MSVLTELGRWISANESLLSGLAAMIVLAGVLFSPVGAGLRRLGRDRAGADEGTGAAAGASTTGPVATSSRVRLSFQDLTKPEPAPIHFADSNGVRIAYNELGSRPPTIIAAPAT